MVPALQDDRVTDFVQVVTTAASREDAGTIARRLLADRLAGCVQVSGPIESSYRWEGDIETAREWYCVIKTSRALFPEVERAIRSVHPYDEPEILAVPVVLGSDGYLGWLAGALRPEA
jgi:periplasmic divalent cation tolerance protein